MPIKRDAASITLSRDQSQRGWIMLEVIVCLALFAVVLKVVQHQSETQWHTIQQAETYRKNQENRQKQDAMKQLVGSVSWLTDPHSATPSEYPDCQLCTGDQLKQWFYAAQQKETSDHKGVGEEP